MIKILKEKREALTIFSYSAAVFEEIIRRSHYCDNAMVLKGCYIILAVASAIAAIKFLLDIFEHRIEKKHLLIIMSGAAYMGFLLIRGQTDAGMLLWLYIAASHDVDFRKLCISFAISSGMALLFVIAGSELQLVVNTEVYRWREGELHIRNSMGFKEVFHGGYFLLFFIMVYLYLRKKRITWAELAGLLAAVGFVFLKGDTQWPFLVSLAVIAAAVILKTVPLFSEYYKVYTCLAIGVLVLGVLFVLIQGAFIDPNKTTWLQKIDWKLSNRLSLNYDAIHHFGVSFWGRNIPWSTGEDAGLQYNWVDSVYLYSLMNYGVPALLGIIAIHVSQIMAAARKKDVFMIVMLSAVAVLGVFDNYCLRVECNTFYLFFAYQASAMMSQEKGCRDR